MAHQSTEHRTDGIDLRALERERPHEGRRALRLFETLSRRRHTAEASAPSMPEAQQIKRDMPTKSYKPIYKRKI